MPSTWTTKVDPKAKLVALIVTIEGPLGRRLDRRLVLDTGSPYTILDVDLANRLDLTANRAGGPSRLWSPTGPQDGYRIRAQSVAVMGRVLRDLTIRCHELEPGLEVDGIVGLDILRQGALHLDLPRGHLEFQWTT
jgi:hypothetical protein